MTPWREIAVPHADVRKGTFQQSEFAADISAVRHPDTPAEYRDAAAFFERTYLTDGLRQLLQQVAVRLSGRGGEPVVQLQTAFGGGKTHTLLAVYHLCTRPGPLSDLAGVSSLVEAAGLMDVPRAAVAVLDGAKLSPGQPWKRGRLTIRTLWGELAYQLGGADGFARVRDLDANGTSPGKELVAEMLAAAAPCVVLVDELANYLRQFEPGQPLPGGTFDTNLSFAQALTEAAKQVPRAAVLASLPDSLAASSGHRGREAIQALEHIFGRVQALWRPVSAEEGFEIVRRRLFEPIRDAAGRDSVCRAFAQAYISEGARLPAETQEARYADRLVRAYPIHPEVFERLYEDWSTLEGFQRTRGVLKLMAKVVYRLWTDSSREPMILPGSLPLADRDTRTELTYLLPAGWEAVIDGDIDGDRAETTELEAKEPRFGQVMAARRVARTLFLGTAPGSAAAKPGLRGLDRGRILLGCLQPGQSAATYGDALDRLADRLFYLNSSGERTAPTTRFWFDTRANLRREMEDRKRRFPDAEVRKCIAAGVGREFAGLTLFDASHVFTPPADVPDDAALRLVVLPPEQWYARDEGRPAEGAVKDYLANHGAQPRHRANRLLFAAADHAVVPRLRDVARVALAWQSIVDDAAGDRLVMDQLQRRQAEKEAREAAAAVPKTARECYRWLLCPTLNAPTDPTPVVEALLLNTSGASLVAELERVCLDNEWVVSKWSPVHLRTKLRELYWAADRPAAGAVAFWEDSLRYLYLPRLRNREVLAEVVRTGAGGRDFFGTADGVADDGYEGFRFGEAGATLHATLVLIEPGAAREYAIRQKTLTEVRPPEAGRGDKPAVGGNGPIGPGGRQVEVPPPPVVVAAKPRSFHGSADVLPATAKMRLVALADEIISVLAADPSARVTVTVEITAEFADGATDDVRRVVGENATTLGFKSANWE